METACRYQLSTVRVFAGGRGFFRIPRRKYDEIVSKL
jgi:hypothetical protein